MAARWERPLVLVLLAFIVAGLIGGVAYLVLRKGPDPVRTAAEIAPAGAVAYIEVAPFRALLDRVEGLGLMAAPGAWPAAREELRRRLRDNLGVDGPDDLERSWGIDADRPLVLIVLAAAADTGAAMEGAPRFVVLLPLESPSRFRVRMEEGEGKPREEEHEGATVLVAQERSWTLLSGHAAVARTADDLRPLLDAAAGRGPTLAKDPAFAGALPSGDLRLWVRGAPLASGARAVRASYGPFLPLLAGDRAAGLDALFGWAVEALDRIETISLAVDLDASTPRLRVRAAVDPAWPLLAALPETPSAFPLLDRVPPGAIVAATAIDQAEAIRATESLRRGLLEASGDSVDGILEEQVRRAETWGDEAAFSMEVRPPTRPMEPPGVLVRSVARLRDPAEAADLVRPSALEADARLAEIFSPGVEVRVRPLPPLDLGGTRAAGAATEVTIPPLLKAEDAAGLPPEVRDQMTRPQRHIQRHRFAVVDGVAFGAMGEDAAAVDAAIRTLVAGASETASAAAGLTAVRSLLPPEGNLLIVLDPSAAVAGETTAALGLLVRRTAPGTIEAEAVWPSAHIAAASAAGGRLLGLAVPARPAALALPEP